MLDGRIDVQGTVKDLRTQGILEGIEHVAAIDAHKELILAERSPGDEDIDESSPKQGDKAKKPRKLVKDEHRETGGVKWSVYKSYLKAS